MVSINRCFIIIKYFVLMFFALMINTGYSQNVKKKELQKEYNNILREIKQIQNNIDKTSRERNIGVNEIAMINSKIEKRQKLIDNIESQAKVIESELQLRVKDVSNLGLEIAKLKEEYTKLILWLNKNHSSVNKLAFVMEANNFKETYHRIQYIY